MSTPSEKIRPWFKKPWFIVSAVVLVLVFIIAGVETSSDGSYDYSNDARSQVQTAPEIGHDLNAVEDASERNSNPAAAQEAQLSNDNYYRNVDGERVHSPAYTSDNSIPAGASARCRDGTYSFSRNRRGTCSQHGGVSQWL